MLTLGERTPKDYSCATIYKITCLANGKIYIGQTTDSLHRRFCSHFWKSSGCIKLKRAIKKYGRDNFVVEQIDHAHSKEEADAKERAYIALYNSTNDKCGYNITKGGDSISYKICKPVICIETGKSFPSASDAARFYKSSPSVLISVCLGKKRMFKGYHWAYLDGDNNPILENIDLTTTPRKKKIRCIETGEVFNSIVEAGKKHKCSHSLICSFLKNRLRTAGGVHWELVEKGK